MEAYKAPTSPSAPPSQQIPRRIIPWACIVQFFLWAILLVSLFTFVPEFADMTEEFGIELPAITVLFLNVCEALPTLVWLMLFFLVQAILIGLGIVVFCGAANERYTAKILLAHRFSIVMALTVLLLGFVAFILPTLSIISGLTD